jgi:peroxiredoxin
MKITVVGMGLVLMMAGIAAGAEPTVRAAIQTAKDRKPAPAFVLTDASGKSVQLLDYRGKIVLLNFWATWCHGCVTEMPWFAEFEKTYGNQDFAVLGVSMDEGGWGIVKPFIEKTRVNYRVLLSDDQTAKKYSIQNMPDTYLIDREGRIAATYVGVVDRENIESNIKAMVAGR